LGIAWEQNAFYDINHFALAAIYGNNDENPLKNISLKKGHLTTQGITVTATIGF
jgi:hypothetical protein